MTYPDEDLAPADHLDPAERDIEAPTDDAVEQSVAANPVEQSPDCLLYTSPSPRDS